MIHSKHDNAIDQIKDSVNTIVDVIDLMAEYKPGLLHFQISEQLYIFETVLQP
jgi:hypothetical protein